MNKCQAYERIVKSSVQTMELARAYDFLCEHPGVMPKEMVKMHNFNKRIYSRLRRLESMNLIKVNWRTTEAKVLVG